MKLTNEMKPKTKFGKWLLDGMIVAGWTCVDVATKLKTTRQCVRNHVNGITKPSYVWVIAYCWMFGVPEYVDDIWQLISEEVDS